MLYYYVCMYYTYDVYAVVGTIWNYTLHTLLHIYESVSVVLYIKIGYCIQNVFIEMFC